MEELAPSKKRAPTEPVEPPSMLGSMPGSTTAPGESPTSPGGRAQRRWLRLWEQGVSLCQRENDRMTIRFNLAPPSLAFAVPWQDLVDWSRDVQ